MRSQLVAAIMKEIMRKQRIQLLVIREFPQIWSLSGAVLAAHYFYLSTKPYSGPDIGIYGWAQTPSVVKPIILMAVLVTLIGLPMFVVGCFIAPRSWQSRTIWYLCWLFGFGLIYLSSDWARYPTLCKNSTAPLGQCAYGSPAVVSWGELALVMAWISLAMSLRALKNPLRPVLTPSNRSTSYE